MFDGLENFQLISALKINFRIESFTHKEMTLPRIIEWKSLDIYASSKILCHSRFNGFIKLLSHSQVNSKNRNAFVLLQHCITL